MSLNQPQTNRRQSSRSSGKNNHQHQQQQQQYHPHPPVSLESIRTNLEAQYIELAKPGKRMRKDPNQMKVLVEEFNKNPKWTYSDKIRIGQRIGMTHHQVAKWNWDYSKKNGVSTKRQKK